jgi:hypothetical protein
LSTKSSSSILIRAGKVTQISRGARGTHKFGYRWQLEISLQNFLIIDGRVAGGGGKRPQPASSIATGPASEVTGLFKVWKLGKAPSDVKVQVGPFVKKL